MARQAAPEATAAWLAAAGAAVRGVHPGDAYVCRLLTEWKRGRPHALDLRTRGPQILRQLETVYDGGARPRRSPAPPQTHVLDLRTHGPQVLRQLETVYDGGARPRRSPAPPQTHVLDLHTHGPQILRQLETVRAALGARRRRVSACCCA